MIQHDFHVTLSTFAYISYINMSNYHLTHQNIVFIVQESVTSSKVYSLNFNLELGIGSYNLRESYSESEFLVNS